MKKLVCILKNTRHVENTYQSHYHPNTLVFNQENSGIVCISMQSFHRSKLDNFDAVLIDSENINSNSIMTIFKNKINLKIFFTHRTINRSYYFEILTKFYPAFIYELISLDDYINLFDYKEVKFRYYNKKIDIRNAKIINKEIENFGNIVYNEPYSYISKKFIKTIKTDYILGNKVSSSKDIKSVIKFLKSSDDIINNINKDVDEKTRLILSYKSDFDKKTIFMGINIYKTAKSLLYIKKFIHNGIIFDKMKTIFKDKLKNNFLHIKDYEENYSSNYLTHDTIINNINFGFHFSKIEKYLKLKRIHPCNISMYKCLKFINKTNSDDENFAILKDYEKYISTDEYKNITYKGLNLEKFVDKIKYHAENFDHVATIFRNNSVITSKNIINIENYIHIIKNIEKITSKPIELDTVYDGINIGEYFRIEMVKYYFMGLPLDEYNELRNTLTFQKNIGNHEIFSDSNRVEIMVKFDLANRRKITKFDKFRDISMEIIVRKFENSKVFLKLPKFLRKMLRETVTFSD